MNTWFISDTHFGHTNIIPYCDRPFVSVEQMNRYMIQQWNAVVKKNDTVYHLGDFSLGLSPEEVKDIVSQLNGNIRLVKGNHDTWNNEKYRNLGFKEVYDKPILVNDFMLLSHEPNAFRLNGMYINVYGHVHNSPMYDTYKNGFLCVCVERHNYKPISLQDIELIVSGG